MTKFVETYVKIIVKKICQKNCQKHNQSDEEMSSIFRYSLILEAPLIKQVDGQLKNEEMRISCIVVFSCWSNFARLSAGIETSPKITCSHVIFGVYFKFLEKNAGGAQHLELPEWYRSIERSQPTSFLTSMKIYFYISILVNSRFKIQLVLITTKDDF